MVSRKKVNIIFIILSLFFSSWLFSKSFGYENGEFRIARHQVGDFGLHIGLIRSFSIGQNIPPQSPFFPGPQLPYHYATDFAAGILERVGIRIDYALNGISIIFFTLLLYLIYDFSNTLFGYYPLRSLISVILFLFSSNLTFVAFLERHSVTQVWRLPDYLFKGPFDGSIISIFSTLNPILNQRHLVVGLALGMLCISYLYKRIVNRQLSGKQVIFIGIFLGLGTRIHSLVALGVSIVAICLFFFFRKTKLFIPFVAMIALFSLPHMSEVFHTNQTRFNFFHPGFLAPTPVTIHSWLVYWWQNLGLVIVFLPIGVFFAKDTQRKVFFAYLPLFILANLLQFSYRIEHNHSLITVFMIVANIFVAHALSRLPKIAIIVSIFFLTASGFLNLMVVKNDFQYHVADYPKDPLISWIIENTSPNAVFLAPANLYDPVVLAGRKNYFGATYYSEVMGYDIEARRAEVESGNMKGVDYHITTKSVVGKQPVYSNEKFWVYKL